MRVRTFKLMRLRAVLAATCALGCAVLPASAWGDYEVIDPAKGFVWTGDPCMQRWQRPYVRVITEADYEAATAEYMAFWAPRPLPASPGKTTGGTDPALSSDFAANAQWQIFQGAATEAQARANVRAWLRDTIYPFAAQVYCPENITNILAWAERRDEETYRALNPAAKDDVPAP